MTKPQWESVEIAYDAGYAAGLCDGEKRLARALRRMLKPLDVDDPITKLALHSWLSARLKKERK